MIICAREGCEETFSRKKHNQKYCGDECCRLATNARIMTNYYKDKEREAGKTRYCTICKDTKLSRYNRKEYCATCQVKREKNANDAVTAMLRNAFTVS